MRTTLAACIVASLAASGQTASRSQAADWPMWRGDSARSGYTTDELPADLKLSWSFHPIHAPSPAWPRDDRMSFDRASHVVISNGTVFFGSSVEGTVTALDAVSGSKRWTYFTGGPVRFAPVVWKDRLYVVSDDGFLYALKLTNGELINRWCGGPADDRVLGNTQIISKWPARGGPVIHDGLLYWGAGIWQSEGIFIHAINPDTGEIVWTNDSSGGLYMPQPHGGANAKSGVSAQGYFLANAERLFVPTGRAVPAAFQRATGKFDYYRLQENTRRGHTSAMLSENLLYNGGYAYQTTDGSMLAERVSGAVARFAGGILHGTSGQLRAIRQGVKDGKDRKGKPTKIPVHESLWSIADVPSGTSLIVAGDKAVTGDGRRIGMVDLQTQKLVWSDETDGVAYGLAAANGRLFVSTDTGAIHCYAAANHPSSKGTEFQLQASNAVYRKAQSTESAAQEILDRAGISRGYCVDLGCGNGALAYQLVKQSDLHVIGIESDPEKVEYARKQLIAAGVYGTRVTIHEGDLSDTHLPRFFANLIVSSRSLTDDENPVDAAEAARLQRPYGGVSCFGPVGSMIVKKRGALEGAGEWTHLYSNPANTLCSTDEVKGPLTAVWFRDIDLNLPQRHGRGPSPLFYQGRLFAEGIDELIAVDAYNGLPLWRFEQKGILDAYNADHLAGTAVTGSNICIAGDSIFLRNGKKCFRLDTATGKVKSTFETPPHPDGKPAVWGYIACEDGILFGSTANESHIVKHAYIRADSHMKKQFSESTSLFAYDVETGKLLWRYNAKESIRHNAIAIGAGRLHLIDRVLAVDDLLANAPARRGEKPKKPPVGQATGKLITLDVKSGEPVWDSAEDIFGTALAFSQAHDVLLMFYQPTSFRLPSEVGGRITAFHAGGGYRLWEKKVHYRTRPLINDKSIIAHPSALDLKTGESIAMAVPKSYGCGQVSGSKNLLMFRSGTLGYHDFTRKAGTENYGGIRPGCWINALPVGGLVLVPDASAGCSCSYQNRSWVALEGSTNLDTH